MKFQDLSEKRFHKWTVLHRAENSIGGRTRWLCQCDCGQQKVVFSCSLTLNKSKQCKNCSNVTHGFNKTHTQGIYFSMIQRCQNPNHKNYDRYGGRGIKICDSWLGSFVNFLEDMGEIPDNLCIDRIDNDGHYCKENCRLVTHKENMNNRSNSIRLGTITNNWKTLKKDINPKNYIIKCLKCKFTKKIRGAYIKILKTHKCEKKND